MNQLSSHRGKKLRIWVLHIDAFDVSHSRGTGSAFFIPLCQCFVSTVRRVEVVGTTAEISQKRLDTLFHLPLISAPSLHMVRCIPPAVVDWSRGDM